ncbi:hypothetical protein [Streptomyces sp. enrichment culture]|uniref:8-oxoguanine DNA glycosylase OGG fold protein n=1 Tax=Streptomyces sp. enrichment culture TaxID=1795815 RepID=UPI003F55F79B
MWRPLIPDRFVALALGASGTDGEWPTSRWRRPRYGRYLPLVHEHARRKGVLPDQLEAALFTHGKHLVRRPRWTRVLVKSANPSLLSTPLLLR